MLKNLEKKQLLLNNFDFYIYVYIMNIKSEIKLTSVKIVKDLYNAFKHVSLDDNINLQKLVNRCILLYVEDKDFRDKLNSTDELKISGSGF